MTVMSIEDKAREQVINPVDEFIAKLTPPEKMRLLSGASLFKTRAIKRFGLPEIKMTDGPHGVGAHSSGLKRMTLFPAAICLGASWDPDLAREFGEAMGSETRLAGRQVLLAPGMNIIRTPLNGRNFEYFTEDPMLNAKMAAPVVKGIQSQGVAACAKHFVANNQEKNKTKVSANISPRALREIYLPAFRSAVEEADVWSVMASYNKINGTYACEHTELIRSVLQAEFGFKMPVISDWLAAKPTKGPENCIKAGLSLEMPGRGTVYRYRRLKRALRDGQIDVGDLNSVLRPLLKLYLKISENGNMVVEPAPKLESAKNRKISRRIAEEGIVLLRNEKKLLPLDANSIRSIAVLGPNAKKKMGRPLYGGSSAVWPPYEITPLAGLKAAAPHVRFVRDPEKANAVIYIGGLNHRFGNDSEGFDRKTMKLPDIQVKTINRLKELNSNLIVVLINGGPVTFASWSNGVPAILEAWYPGMEGGHAIADILFGKICPSGKLPISFPNELTDSPAHRSEESYPGSPDTDYAEGIYVGYRHFDKHGIQPEFPFGFGLSYTEFELSNAKLSQKSHSGNDPISLSVDIRNKGPYRGAEVIQIYSSKPVSDIDRPVRELRAFKKVWLDSGAEEEIQFHMNTFDLAYFDEGLNSWNVEPGEYTLQVCTSSRDRHQELHLVIQ